MSKYTESTLLFLVFSETGHPCAMIFFLSEKSQTPLSGWITTQYSFPKQPWLLLLWDLLFNL